MNINLMIDNILLPNAGVGLSRTTITPQQSADQFNPASVDNPPFDDIPQIITADNNPVTIPAEPSGEETQQFQQVLGKKVSPEAPRKLQENKKSCISNKAPMPGAFSTNNIEHPLLAQIAQQSAISDMMPDNVPPAAQEIPKPTVGQQLARTLVESNTAQLPYVAGQAVKTINNNSILTTQQMKPGLETVSPGASSGEFTANIQSLNAAGLPENAQKTSNGTIITATNPADGENGGESTPEMLTGNGKAIDGELTPEMLAGNGKTIDGQEPVANDSPNATAQADVLSLQSEKPMPEANGDSKAAVPGENIIMTGKTIISDGQQTSVSPQDININAQLQTNSAAVNPQLANNDTLTTSNTNTGLNDQIISELSDGSTKDSQSTGDNSTGQFVLKDLNPEQVTVTSGQTKDNNIVDSNFEQVISVNNVQGDIAEQTSATTANQRTDGNADMTTDIGEQIQSAVLQDSSRQGEKQITIRLNPPELGKVYIKFEQQNEQIIGLLEVEKLQTRIELQQLLPQIVRNLNDSGITVKKLEVTLTNEQQQQAYKDQSLTSGQDGWSGQQDSENPGNQSSSEEYYEWLTSTLEDSYTGFAQPQEMLVTNNSINMLV